jgi:hypothetical protein
MNGETYYLSNSTTARFVTKLTEAFVIPEVLDKACSIMFTQEVHVIPPMYLNASKAHWWLRGRRGKGKGRGILINIKNNVEDT